MKQALDEYIAANYQKLICIAQNKITYFKRHGIDAETMVSDAYLYVSNNLPANKDDIPKYIVQYINTELKYPKSRTVKQYSLKCLNGELLPLEDEHDIENELDVKLTFDGFRETLCIYDQIAWDVYKDKGKRRIVEMSDHFVISMSSANEIRKRILTKFKNYYESKS